MYKQEFYGSMKVQKRKKRQVGIYDSIGTTASGRFAAFTGFAPD